MRVHFCGVRGSTPVAGPEFARVGGHTSCVALALGDALPDLVLDAGTGLQSLVTIFEGRPFVGNILLTHLHWDHVQGLPFFPQADRDDARVTVAQPAQGDPLATMARAMSPPHFPINPDGLRGAWEYVALEAGEHDFGPYTVVARDVEHKGGRAFGFRVTAGSASLAYVPDALDANDDAILALADGVDLFIRGAPFVSTEQERADLFGHGTVERAVTVAGRAGVRQLVLTHHGPMRTDDAVEKIASDAGVLAATDGLVLEI